MSEQTNTAVDLEWDIADRMRKALRASGIGVQEMAEYLGVARNTVSTWINGRVEPNQQTQRLWAIRCGVPYEWLKSGQNGNGPTPGERESGGGADLRFFVAPAPGLEPGTCRLTTLPSPTPAGPLRRYYPAAA